MLLLNRKHLHKAALWFSKRYNTKIVGLYLGDGPAIIVNDWETVKKALYTQSFDGKGGQILLAKQRHPDFNVFGRFSVAN